MHQWSQLKPGIVLKALSALAERGERRRVAKSTPQPAAPAEPAPDQLAG